MRTFPTSRLNALGPSGVAYEHLRSDATCGVIPNPINSSTDVFTGGTLSGNLCWVVSVEDAADLVMYAVGPLGRRGAGRVFFALTAATGPTGGGTGRVVSGAISWEEYISTRNERIQTDPTYAEQVRRAEEIVAELNRENEAVWRAETVEQREGQAAARPVAVQAQAGTGASTAPTAPPPAAPSQVNPSVPPPLTVGEVMARRTWWEAHNSCAVALGRAMVSAPLLLVPPDADQVGTGFINDPSLGLESSLVTSPGILVLGGANFASANETLRNWDRLPSLLAQARTRQPPPEFAAVYLPYLRALAGLRSASGTMAEGTMSAWTSAAARAEFARQLERLEAVWPARPRVDLADCATLWR